jgi:hypothetical protein
MPVATAGDGPAAHGATWAAGPRDSVGPMILLAVLVAIFAFELWWIANC